MRKNASFDLDGGLAMENTKIFIKLESPKERDEFFEALTIFILGNVERSLAIKRRICSLAGFPEVITKDEEEEEKQVIFEACEKIAPFFLGEIDDGKLSEELAQVIYAHMTKIEKPVSKDDERSIRIFCKKALPIIKWEAFPGASAEIAARYINAAIRLADSKGITLREFFKSEDYYREMIVSLYQDSESFASELAGWITGFFTLALAESVYIDSMVESGEMSAETAARQKLRAEKNEEDQQDSKKVALAGAMIAVESAAEIFGKACKKEEKLKSLFEELHKLNKTVVLA